MSTLPKASVALHPGQLPMTLVTSIAILACGLTPELSGGGAVRLNEELGACAAPCLGDCAGTPRTPPSATLAALDAGRLPRRCKGNDQVWKGASRRRLGRST